LIKILIIGLGSIGIRHFESIYYSKNKTHIDCLDVSESVLNKIKIYIEDENCAHKIRIFNDINRLDKNYDILIHSTNSNVRINTLQLILKRSNIKFAILEKVLCQSLEDLKKIKLISKSFKKCWVNTPMHEWDIYNKIKKQININDVSKIEFNNCEGMACNTIHKIDFVSSWKNQLPDRIDTSNLGEWYDSKRKGFFDVYGEMTVIYPDKTELILRSYKGKSDYHCLISENKQKWILNEKDEKFSSTSGYKGTGVVEYQSQLTQKIINKILDNENCNLPNIDWSIKCHEILIVSLLSYWNSYYKVNHSTLPIT